MRNRPPVSVGWCPAVTPRRVFARDFSPILCPSRIARYGLAPWHFRDEFTAVIRRKHYPRKTERTYWAWIAAFLRFHRGPDGWRHPSDLGAAEVEAFLTHLAVDRRVAASTQDQALNAIVFLFKQVLEIDPGSFNAVRARPTVLSRREIRALLREMTVPVRLFAEAMYGGDSGRRLCRRNCRRHLRCRL